MTTTTGKATGSFTIKAWDEQPWAEVEEAPKLTHARVTTAYTGDLEGEGTYQLLMVYDGADATYTGYERVAGSLDGRTGSFVLRLDGGFEGGAARTGLDGGRGVGHRRPGRPPGRGRVCGQAWRARRHLGAALVAGLDPDPPEARTAPSTAAVPLRRSYRPRRPIGLPSASASTQTRTSGAT